MLKDISKELKAHAPFTMAGAATGIVIMVIMAYGRVTDTVSHTLFWFFHPIHILLSALVTAGMYRLHGRGSLRTTILVGYLGSIGIATVSDCIIPYVGEYLLGLPNRGVHFGFIEKWWLVNSLAAAGIAIAYRWPNTRFPHAGHVLLSTWASLFHMTMALEGQPGVVMVGLIAVFLFVAVWIPCCTSDIVFPLLFTKEDKLRVPHGVAYDTSR